MSTYVAISVIAMAVGLVLCVPVGLTLWSVLGESHFLVRLAGLLACIGLVGSFFADDARANQLSEKGALLFMLLLLAGSFWLFQHWLSRTVTLLLFGGMIWSICQHLLPSLVDPRSYAAASIAIPLAASLVLTFRILGFRFIRLTGIASDADIERGTGMNVDAWLSELRHANGEQMTRSEIATFLRQRGVPFSWQRVLVDAYEMSIGRRIIRVSGDGIPETVVSHSHLGKAALVRTDVARFRWSLRQLLALSVVSAGLFALARMMSLEIPSARQMGLLMTGAVGVAVISIPVLAAELSVERHWFNRAVYLAVALFLSWQIPLMLGMRTPLGLLAGAILSILFFTAWLVAAVTLVRHNGYRVVLAGHPVADRRPIE